MLFSTKNYAHRVPLHSGIYAELTLIYRNKSYQPVEWTYPDYSSKAYLDFFSDIRYRYQQKINLGPII